MLDNDAVAEAVAWRRDLHRHPETAYEEHRTSRFIAGLLSDWGLHVRTGYAGTGVVGTLSRGGGRAVALRADIDALPLTEETGLPHASRTPGKMHACGHDGHTAMLLAAAKHCAADPRFDGTVHFVFQPAEENEAGARRMIEDGLFRDCATDAVYALHNWPGLEVGRCVARDGAMMAALATFEIEVRGIGAHAAMPQEGADPITACCHIGAALQTIPGRSLSPLDAVVVSPTQIHAGDSWNVIPERCVLRGTVRWFDDGAGRTVETRIAALAGRIAEGFDCTATVRYDRRYPATVNHPAEAARVRAVAAGCGLTMVDAPPSMAAEDFAFMLEEKPGCYAWIGARRDGDNPGLHSPRYDFNDAVLPVGAGLLIALARQACRGYREVA